MGAGLQIQTLDGSQAQKYLADIARLRISVFRDYPYLYDGNMAYERDYLETYFKSRGARVVLCREGDRIVGASTVIPLQDESDAFKLPIIHHGWDPADVMYFGESVLESEYRGRGVGKQFFEARLKHARETAGIKRAIFCAVVRPETHTLRPKDYRPLNNLWESYGFHAVPGLQCSLVWKQIDEAQESAKTLQFWVKEL
jgi:GNAT superfamily N-acetyltransferase